MFKLKNRIPAFAVKSLFVPKSPFAVKLDKLSKEKVVWHCSQGHTFETDMAHIAGGACCPACRKLFI